MRIVTKSFLRYVPRRRSLSVLQLIGIACGVAAAVGMTLSARAALQSFSRAVEFLRGNATHSIQRPAGPAGEEMLPQLMRDRAVVSFSPVIDRTLRLADGDLVRLMGIDPLLDRHIRPELANIRLGETQDSPSERPLDFLLDSRAVLLDQGLAQRLGLRPNDTLETSRGSLRVVGTFSSASGEPLVLMDIAHVQSLLGLGGTVDRVDLILNDPSAFHARWEKGFRLESNKQRKESLGDMLRAFRLNLEALSLLALFVGVFLIYNTTMFAVISRRKDAGILRSMGATRYEIIAAFLTELLLLGFLGGVLGGILGYGLSRFLTDLVGGTITNLYFFLRPTPVAWSGWVIAAGVLLGCGASLLGGIFPLTELVRLDPIQTLQGRTASREGIISAERVAAVGLAVLALSAGMLLFSAFHVYVGFASAFMFLIAASLLVGIALIGLGPPTTSLLRLVGSLPGKIAAGNIRRNLSRTGVAVAAFMVALSMSIGLGSMIGSFRHSLLWWMDTQLRADLYIATMSDIQVPLDFYEELKGVPGIGGLDPYRNVQAMYNNTPIYISAVDGSVLQRYTEFGWLRGGNEHWDAVKEGAVIISESFSRRFGVKAGDRVLLSTAQGSASFPVEAVFYDYTTEHGLIMMDRSTYVRYFGDRTINSLGVFVDGNNPRRQAILEEVRRRAAQRGLPVSTGQQLHGNILAVFDSTFAVTRSMRALAIVVAFFGIAGALLTLFMERQREFGIYRALGFSTRQVAGMTLLEGLGMGLTSFVLSIPAGTVLAFILIKVINLRSFNWTIFFYFSWDPYLLAAVTAFVASVGAAAYPIWRVCRTYPQMQIREE